MYYKYKNIIFDDVVLKKNDTVNDWVVLCQKHKKLFPNDFVQEGGFQESTCSIKDCENKADYYIDFPDGELKEVCEFIVKMFDMETMVYAKNSNEAIILAKAEAIKQDKDYRLISITHDGQISYFCVVCHNAVVDVGLGYDTCGYCSQNI